MNFGEKIKFLREQNGLLQREIAAELKIDTPMYSKLEGGARKAKKQQVLQLAKILNVREEELVAIWLADKIFDLLNGEQEAFKSILIAGESLYPGKFYAEIKNNGKHL